MTHIEQMIKDMCPHGVEWKQLGEVCTIETGKLNANAAVEGGQYPFFTTSKEISYINDYKWDTEALLIAGNANIGDVKHYIGKFNAYQRTYVLTSFEESLIVRFLYHYTKARLRDFLDDKKNEAAMSYIVLSSLQAFPVPIPPLDIQKKIVECLDKFSALAAELQAELQARRKQYEFYRTQLLTPPQNISFGNSTDDRNWKWKTLGEIGEMIKGSGIQKSDFVDEGKPCIHYGQVHTYYGTFAYTNKSFISEELYAKCKKAHTGDLIIATTSEDVEACCKATAWLGTEDVAVSGDAHIYRHNQNPKYMAYLFQTEMFAQQKRKCATGAKVTRVHSNDILKFRFAFPPLAEQARIVTILDKFEALTNSLSDGIPAEQAAQQKRYEYYRDRLLTFPKAEK